MITLDLDSILKAVSNVMRFTIPLLVIGEQPILGKRISVVIHKRLNKKETGQDDCNIFDGRKVKKSDVWDHFDKDPGNPHKTICKICNKSIVYKNRGTSAMKVHLMHHKIGVKESSKKFDGRTIKKSDVWDHFDRDPDDRAKTICKICRKSIVYNNGGTSAMKIHLKHHQKGGSARPAYKPRGEPESNNVLSVKKEEEVNLNQIAEDESNGMEDENHFVDGDMSPKPEEFYFKMSPKQEVEDNDRNNGDSDYSFLEDIPENEQDFPEDLPEQSLDSSLGGKQSESECEAGSSAFQRTKSESMEDKLDKLETEDKIPKPVMLNILKVKVNEKVKRNVSAGMSVRHKSQVWEYFEKDPANPERTICKVCGKGGFNYKRHNTGSMMRHIKDHKDVDGGTVNSKKERKLKGENRKGKSRIWEYYDRDSENKFMSICKICQEKVKYPNWEPWYMEKHMLTKHDIRVRQRERWGSKPVLKLNPETGKVERPVVKSRQDKKREVWNYFNFLAEDNSAVSCKICLQEIHNTSKTLDGGTLANQLVKHMNGHNIRLEEQTCSVCGLTFDERSKFTVHMRLHFLTEENGHPCKYCGKLWISRPGGPSRSTRGHTRGTSLSRYNMVFSPEEWRW